MISDSCFTAGRATETTRYLEALLQEALNPAAEVSGENE
jgi:hypothetical protein